MLGPSLIFDKSTLQSLNLDEAVLLENFYSSVLTPIFFVECLADLEKEMRSKSTPEQLVGSLADRTPETCRMQVHHMDILQAELSRQFDIRTVLGRPCIAEGRYIQLGDQRGMVFHQSKEQEALLRWTNRQFFEVERDVAKWWRRALTSIDLDAMSARVMKEIAPHCRTPRTIEDARRITDVLIDQTDPQWMFQFGLTILGLPEAVSFVLQEWISKRRPPLREYVPYFTHMLSINIFFAIVQPAQLLRNVKQSHQIDLAYLYYLPFCSVFTSKDNFHVQIVPLFMNAGQTFVNGVDLKNDLKKLDDFYSALSETELNMGLSHFAGSPPLNTDFLTTRLWDTYLPKWRTSGPRPVVNAQIEQALEDMLKEFKNAKPSARQAPSLAELSYVSMNNKIRLRKGKWRRYSEETEQRIIDGEKRRT